MASEPEQVSSESDNENVTDEEQNDDEEQDDSQHKEGGEEVIRGSNQVQELATKVISIYNRRYYLDMKQRGQRRFIKMSELTLYGRKNSIFMSMRVTKRLVELLDNIIGKLTETNEKSGDPAIIHSEKLVADRRRYFLDLCQNDRGIYLRFTNEDFYGARVLIMLPFEAIITLHDCLKELSDKFGQDDQKPECPEPRFIIDKFSRTYIEVDRNSSGKAFKVSEVRPIGPKVFNVNSISISRRNLPLFTRVLNEMNNESNEIQKNGNQKNRKNTASHGTSSTAMKNKPSHSKGKMKDEILSEQSSPTGNNNKPPPSDKEKKSVEVNA